MKINVVAEEALKKSLQKTLGVLAQDTSWVDSPREADFIVAQGEERLKAIYASGKRFALIASSPPEGKLPDNVVFCPIAKVLTFLLEEIGKIASGEEKGNALKIGRVYEPTKGDLHFHVLVVDDKLENLQIALDLLREHFLTLADSYDLAIELMANNCYDAILSDCQMPPGQKSALASSAIKIGETVHNGLFLMFPATKAGSRFAIVTDANHHKDWVSAILDGLRAPQIINGQPVIFFNAIGKDWKQALDELMKL